MDNGGLLVLVYIMISFFVIGIATSLEVENPVSAGLFWPLWVVLISIYYSFIFRGTIRKEI